MKKKNLKISRNLKYGSLATAMVAVVIVLVIVVNVISGLLTDRFYLKLDLTSERILEIDPQAIEVLKNIEIDVKISVMAQESAFSSTYNDIYEILSKYVASSNGRLEVVYVDPDINPTYYEKYDALGTMMYYDLIVESEKRYRVVGAEDLFSTNIDYESYTYTVTGLQVDQKLVSAILYVQTDTLPVAAIMQGHGETVLSELEYLLRAGNYELQTVNLALEDIPDGTELIVIANPVMDYASDEIRKLDSYFEREGNAIIALSDTVSSSRVPNLVTYFAEWGVEYGDRYIMDNVRGFGHPMYVVPDLTSAEINTGLGTGGELLVNLGARPIEILFEQQGWFTTTSVLRSSSSSYTKDIDPSNIQNTYVKDAEDPAGPFDMAVLVDRYVTGGRGDKHAYALFCSTGMLYDQVLSMPNFINNKYMIKVISEFNPDSDFIVIEEKLFADTTLTMLTATQDAIGIILIGVIPVTVLIFGLIVWLRRRHL